MIGIWYNPHTKKFYTKHVRTAFLKNDYKVGLVNQYEHELVALFVIEGNKLDQCESFWEYLTEKNKKNQPIMKRLKNKFFNWLIKKLERSVKNGD